MEVALLMPDHEDVFHFRNKKKEKKKIETNYEAKSPKDEVMQIYFAMKMIIKKIE